MSYLKIPFLQYISEVLLCIDYAAFQLFDYNVISVAFHMISLHAYTATSTGFKHSLLCCVDVQKCGTCDALKHREIFAADCVTEVW